MPSPLPRPFRLKRPIDPNSNMDLDDVLAAKRALAGLGFMDLPDYGLTPYPDRPMIKAVEAFQSRHDLQVDGVMKPDGPTLETLNRTLAEHLPAAPRTPGRFSGLPQPERRSLLDRPLASTRPGASVPIRARLPAAAGTPDKDASGSRPRPAGPRLAMADKPRFPLTRGPEGALIFSPWRGIGGGGGAAAGIGAAIGAGIAAQQLLRQKQKKQGIDEVKPPPEPGAAVRPRTDIAPHVPPPPGLEPPGEDNRPPDKTESLPTPVELPDLSQPLPKVDKPTVFIHPVLPEELRQGMIIERKGNEATRKELERIRDYFLQRGWKHIAGGRYGVGDPALSKDKASPGDERAEFRVPGHFGSLKGGHFTDLTFELEDGRIVHVQTVDVDHHGKPSQREIDAAERIRKATGDSVLLIPKGAQLDRFRQRLRR